MNKRNYSRTWISNLRFNKRSAKRHFRKKW